MPQIAIDADTLGDLCDGAARLIINSALKTAIGDLDDRGQEDLKERKIQVVVGLKPRKGGGADVYVEAVPVLPKMRTNDHNTIIRRRSDKSELLFNAGSRLAADQTTLDDHIPQDKE